MATPSNLSSSDDDEDHDCEPVYFTLTGLPAGTTVEVIEDYLSAAISDDDPKIENATMLGSGTATVKVSGVKDIEGFLQRKHKIKKQTVEISLYEPSPPNSCYQQDEKISTTSQPDDIIPDTIEVTGEDVSNTEVLELYFQGVQSGGKREKEVEWIKHVDEGIVHVKFLLSEDAAAVVAQEKHSFMKKSLYVRYVPAPPPEVPKQYQKDKLFIRDIPEGVDPDFLTVFIEGRLAIENENDFTLDFKSDCALLLFTHMYTDEELTAMINKLTSKKVKKSQLTVERCEVNCSIYVSNITNKSFTTVDALEMYFDNSRSGAGEGTIESVEMLTKYKAKITFKDPSVILRVLEKKHERLGPNVSITECTVLDSLELTNESGTDEDEDEVKEKEEVAEKSKKKSKEPQAKTNEKVVEEEEKAEDISKKKTKKKGKKQKKQEEVEETGTSTTSPEQEKPPVPQIPLQPVILPLDPLLAKYLRFKPNMTEGIAKEFLVSISIDDSRGIITITPTSSSPIDWPIKSEEMIKDVFSSTLSKVDIAIPPETANTIYPMIMKFCNEGGLQYAFGQGGNKLSIAGDIGSVTKLQNDVQELCSRLIKKEEVITLNPEDYCFLKGLMFPLIQKQHPSITFQCNDQHLTLSMNGSIKDVGEFCDKINHYLVHSKAPVNLQPLAVKFLQEGAGRQVLQNITKGSNVVPYFANKENQTCLLLLSRSEQVETVAARIQQEVCVKTDNLPQSFQSRVAESPKYAAFQGGLSKKHSFLATVHRNQLIIASTSTSIGEVSQSFKSFIAEECSITKDIRLKRGVWRLFHATSMEKKWTDLVSGMRENGVNIVSSSKPTARKPFLRIKGEIINVEHAAEKIQELQCAVKERQMQISRPGICQYFHNDPNGQMVLKGIENEAQVSIEMGVDDDEADNVSKPSQGTPQFTRICFGTTSGLKTITIFVGDITKFNRAEVIVNAANEDLKHIGGVALAIAEKGGPIIQQESDNYVQFKGKVSTGSAVLFNRVGNLPYKAIVHAVGPRWIYGGNHEREIALLKKAIRTSLSKARDYTSIALPAISSGIYGFPSDVCADALVEAAVEFSKNDPDSNISEINFVVLQDNADVFLAAAKKHMENVRTVQDSPAATHVTTPTSNQGDDTASRRRRRGSTKPTTSVIPQDTPSIPTTTTSSSNQSSHANAYKSIKITKGSILKFQEEVLVNSTDQNLGFGGLVAQQLAKAAGPGLAEECQNVRKPISFGDVVTTGAYNLSSKYVIHVVLPGYDGPGGNSEKVLGEVVQKCLAECTRLKAKSISIPSIGAGNLKYPDNVVSKVLIEEAASYLEHNSGKTSLQVVHFVVFDQRVYDAFQKCYQANSSGTVSPSSKRESTPTTKTTRSRTRQSSQQKNTHQSFSEVRRDDQEPCIFSLPHGLHLEVVQGDISSDDCDVIVNTTNRKLQLVGSGVAGAILKKGGRELQVICDAVVSQGIMAEEGKVVTTPSTGELKCKMIFHIAFENKDSKNFVKTIHACLETAEKKGFTSIAFPAVGTGTHGYPAESAARAMVDAIKKFTGKKPKHVKIIRMVLFDSRVYQQFSDAFKSMGESSGGLLSYIYKGAVAIGSFFGYGGEQENGWDEVKSEEVNEKDHEDDEDFNTAKMLSILSLDSKVILHIYGETEHSVMRAEKRLRAIIDTQFISEDVIDEKIVGLSDFTTRELESLAKEHNVDIDIDRHPSIYTIKLHGCQQDVLLVKDKVRDAMSALTQEESKKVAADVVYKTIRWKRMLSTEEEEEYGEDLNFEIEQAYQKKDGVFKCEEDDFYIDFTKMEEKDTVTDKVVKVKRMDLIQAAAEDKPKDWDPMPTDAKGKEKHVHLVPLAAGSPEYNSVESQFNKTMVKGSNYSQIVSIQRLQNPVLYQQYMVRKKEMDKHNPPGHQNERWLFHGTSPDTLDKINTQGFNRSFAGKNATAYGKGVYFAVNSNYSHGYASLDGNGYRYMYLTRVLTGEYTVGNGSMVVPPPKNAQINQHVLFDSTVNNAANPAIFVVYTDAQNYPAYVITYQ